MAGKQLLFAQDARDKIRRGVDLLAEAVKVTLGPRGRTVLLDREFGPPLTVDCMIADAPKKSAASAAASMGEQAAMY